MSWILLKHLKLKAAAEWSNMCWFRAFIQSITTGLLKLGFVSQISRTVVWGFQCFPQFESCTFPSDRSNTGNRCPKHHQLKPPALMSRGHLWVRSGRKGFPAYHRIQRILLHLTALFRIQENSLSKRIHRRNLRFISLDFYKNLWQRVSWRYPDYARTGPPATTFNRLTLRRATSPTWARWPILFCVLILFSLREAVRFLARWNRETSQIHHNPKKFTEGVYRVKQAHSLQIQPKTVHTRQHFYLGKIRIFWISLRDNYWIWACAVCCAENWTRLDSIKHNQISNFGSINSSKTQTAGRRVLIPDPHPTAFPTLFQIRWFYSTFLTSSFVC